MAKLANILVYEWEAWKGFLISHMVADYCRLNASYDDRIGDIEGYLSPNIKAVLMQVNLSRAGEFPAHRAELIRWFKARGLLVLNEHVTDISKSSLHELLENAGIPGVRVTGLQGDTQSSNTHPVAPEQLLIVKTNLNWGGELEQRLPEAIRHKIYGAQDPSMTGFDRYYVTTAQEVSTDMWQDSSLVIERFVENREDSFFRVYCCGEALVVVRAHCHGPIKKISGDARDVNYCCFRHQLGSGELQIPLALQQLLEKFVATVEIDYFCLDIVHDGYEFFIVDLNVTPYSGVQEQTSKALNFLTEGLKQQLVCAPEASSA